MRDIGTCRRCRWYDEGIGMTMSGTYQWSMCCMKGGRVAMMYVRDDEVERMEAMMQSCRRKWWCGWRSRDYHRMVSWMPGVFAQLEDEYRDMDIAPACDMMMEQLMFEWNGGDDE